MQYSCIISQCLSPLEQRIRDIQIVIITSVSIRKVDCIVFASIGKGVYSKRKEVAPNGSKFFLFRIDPFSEWT